MTFYHVYNCFKLNKCLLEENYVGTGLSCSFMFRAEFDVFLCKQEKTREQEVQLYICCNFCGKSISFESLANRNRVMNCNTGSGPPIKPRVCFTLHIMLSFGCCFFVQ